jgi:hypothetical protein
MKPSLVSRAVGAFLFALFAGHLRGAAGSVLVWLKVTRLPPTWAASLPEDRA